MEQDQNRIIKSVHKLKMAVHYDSAPTMISSDIKVTVVLSPADVCKRTRPRSHLGPPQIDPDPPYQPTLRQLVSNLRHHIVET